MEKVCLDDVQIVMKRYLDSLIQKFDLNIPQRGKELEWVHNPFAVDVDALPESCQNITGFEEEFINIQCGSSLTPSLCKTCISIKACRSLSA